MPAEVRERQYRVVVNDEEQYSIWPVELEIPGGWHDAAVIGDKQTCLDHIERTWTDMRPRSLRERMSRRSAAADRPGA